MTTIAVKRLLPGQHSFRRPEAAFFPAHAELSAEELAKLAQNPGANLISVPFQYNANLNYGPQKDTQSILNIQPVIPFE